MILPDLSNCLTFRTSKSSGKGGQHVNKTESRVELIFALEWCNEFSSDQKSLIRLHCANRINQNDELQLSCDTYRSQIRNKEEVLKQFYSLIQKALKPVKKRKKTKVPKSVILKRKESKNRRSEIKESRKKIR